MIIPSVFSLLVKNHCGRHQKNHFWPLFCDRLTSLFLFFSTVIFMPFSHYNNCLGKSSKLFFIIIFVCSYPTHSLAWDRYDTPSHPSQWDLYSLFFFSTFYRFLWMRQRRQIASHPSSRDIYSLFCSVFRFPVSSIPFIEIGTTQSTTSDYHYLYGLFCSVFFVLPFPSIGLSEMETTHSIASITTRHIQSLLFFCFRFLLPIHTIG